MSKYDKLWNYIKRCNEDNITLSFEEIEKIAGVPIDHSFLRYKKELADYGYTVGKISMKEQTVKFERLSKKDTVLLYVHEKGGSIDEAEH